MTQKDIVRQIVRTHQKTEVELGEFFLSWNAVPTLAYKGFSSQLLGIKRQIETVLPGLQPENSGSMWPKTTLGALRDDKILSWNDAVVLRGICDRFLPQVKGQRIQIDSLAVVLFHCRSLERRISTEPISLADPRDTTGPTQDHLKKVSDTMEQFAPARLVEYWPNLQKPGNKESHYRAPFIQATLVYDLQDIPQAITAFRMEVDQHLPGLYSGSMKIVFT